MAFTYEYPRPSLTVDTVVIGNGPIPRLLLIRRDGDPCKDMWALPGGFVNVNDLPEDQGEEVEEAARRELEEETGLKVKVDDLYEVGTFSSPNRDSRGRMITVAFMTVVDQDKVQPKAGDDAAETKWFTAEEISGMELAFDHKKIVFRALNSLMAMSNEDE